MDLIKFKLLVLSPVIITCCIVSDLTAQLLGSGYQTEIKTEYQYTDYTDYTYPDPILYQYPDVAYLQPQPYISSFPEHRFLTKITQYFGFYTNLGLRYQRGILDDDNRQNIYNAKLNHELNEKFSVMGAYQYMELNNQADGNLSYAGHMMEVGGKFNFAGAVHVEPSYAFFTAGYFSPEAEEGGGHSLTVKLRQALSPTTALQAKYNYLTVDYKITAGTDEKYHANTMTTWLSQWLPTETALHLSGRFYWNSSDTRSFSPGIEAAQYVKWNIILHLSYRYYKNTPKVESFLEKIKGDSFSTNAVSAILDYRFSANTTFGIKYRFYTSNQDVSMNTYLLSWEQIF